MFTVQRNTVVPIGRPVIDVVGLVALAKVAAPLTTDQVPDAGDGLLLAADNGSDGRAKSLAEARGDGVGMLHDLANGIARGNRCVPDAGAVDVRAQAACMRALAHVMQLFDGPDATAPAIVCVLHADQACAWAVVVVPANERFHGVCVEHAALARCKAD